MLTVDVNPFVEALPKSHNGLALSNVSREDRGPLTIVTVTYGDGELTSDNEDGEISWWTVSGGVYTFHIKRWVDNTPDAIKAFCSDCMTSYGYEKDEVNVSCNPIAGEARVMCEATFTPDVEINEEDDPTTDWGDDPENIEETESENTEGVQCSSTIDTLTPSAALYLELKLGVHDGRGIISVVNAVEAGEVVYRESGSMGGRIKTDGWYSTDDTNPNALDSPVYYDSGDTTKDNVDRARVLLKSIPDVMVPSLRVTIVNKVTSSSKVSMSSLTSKMSGAGSMSDSISGGIGAPAITFGWDAEGTQYPVKEVKWLNEGASFDGTSVRKRSSLTTGKTFYEGTMSESFRSVAVLQGGACEASTSVMAL